MLFEGERSLSNAELLNGASTFSMPRDKCQAKEVWPVPQLSPGLAAKGKPALVNRLSQLIEVMPRDPILWLFTAMAESE